MCSQHLRKHHLNMQERGNDMWILIDDNNVIKIFSQPEDFIFNAIKYSKTIFKAWSKEELNNFGIWNYIPLNINSNTHQSTNPIIVKVINRYEEQATIVLKSIGELQKFRINEVNVLNNKIKDAGITVNSFDVSTSPGARADLALAGTYALSQNSLPVGFKWPTLNQGLISLNLTQFIILFESVGKHIIDSNIAADIHIQAINSLIDGQQIIDYNITTNWPATL